MRLCTTVCSLRDATHVIYTTRITERCTALLNGRDLVYDKMKLCYAIINSLLPTRMHDTVVNFQKESSADRYLQGLGRGGGGAL